MKQLNLFKPLLLFCIILLCACSPSAKKPIGVLIVTGQNNHNWQVSHKAIGQILENSGMFAVDFAISPAKGNDMSGFTPDFSSYQLVVLDYNGDAWPAATNDAFLQYVKGGGGVVVYHAANNAFPDWKEFNEITALGGWEGRNEKSGPYVYWQDGKLVRDESPGTGGSHGRQHIFALNGRDMKHPITKGLPAQWKHAKDELYDRMRGPGNIAALLYSAYSDKETGGSGREEPLLFTVNYGKGRIFHTMLGHAGTTLEENTAMQCTGFQVTLLRGCEWAATGKVTQKVPADFPTATEITYRDAYKEE